MTEVDFKHPATPLATICDSAAVFGLAPNEIWEAVIRTLDRLPRGASSARRSDELAGALARRLLEKQRRDS